MKKSLKICYIGWGDSIHTQRWIEWFRDREHEIHLITNRPSGMNGIVEHNIESLDKYSTNRIKRYLKLQFNIPSFSTFRKILAIKKLINQIKPHILHLHTLLYPSNLGAYLGFHPMVVTLWNGDIVWVKQKSLLHRYTVKRALKRADIVTGDSEELLDGCKVFVKDLQRLKMVNFGVNTSIFKSISDIRKLKIKKNISIEKSSAIILSTRSFQDIYNIDIILKSIPYVIKFLPDAVFVFTHYSVNKEYRDFLLNIVKQLGLKKSVYFLGHIPEHKDLAQYYALADVWVSVSSCDTSPVSLTEAMACEATPVVGDLPSIREWIKDGWNGFVVPLRDEKATADAIVKLLSQKKKRNLFTDRNTTIVREIADLNANMKKVETMYLNLIPSFQQKKV